MPYVCFCSVQGAVLGPWHGRPDIRDGLVLPRREVLAAVLGENVLVFHPADAAQRGEKERALRANKGSFG